MVIFHSYVSLPEGMLLFLVFFPHRIHDIQNFRMRKREFEEIEIFCRMCSHQKGHCHQCVSDRYQEIAILSLKGETARKVHKFHTNK